MRKYKKMRAAQSFVLPKNRLLWLFSKQLPIFSIKTKMFTIIWTIFVN